MSSVRSASSWDHYLASDALQSSHRQYLLYQESLHRREDKRDVEGEVQFVADAADSMEARLESTEEERHERRWGDTFGSQIPSQVIESLGTTSNSERVELSLLDDYRFYNQRRQTTLLESDRPISFLGDPERNTFIQNDSNSEEEPAQTIDTTCITSQSTLHLPSQEIEASQSAAEAAISSSMGVSSWKQQPTAWSWSNMAAVRSESRRAHCDEDKMEEATAQTATSISLQKEDDETIDSATVSSPQSMRPVPCPEHQQVPSLHVRVPSTTSTAASTVADDGSFHHQQQYQQQQHQRAPSWDSLSLEQLHQSFPSSSQQSSSSFQPWQQQHQAPQPDRHFFRSETMITDNRWDQRQHNMYQQQQQQHIYQPQQRIGSGGGPPQHPLLVGQRGASTHPSAVDTTKMQRGSQQFQPSMAFPVLSMQQRHSPANGADRSYSALAQQQQHLPPSAPPRQPSTNAQQQHSLVHSHARPPHRMPQQQQQPGSPMHQSSSAPLTSGGARSASEVLKTLLRKKACLYEPDTSRAVALVTWLVGRELALEFGFFSRQQLQAGVHACVAQKIDSNMITRTKVNRCMQIILNSCFHYIIPRPDGTEENGSSFSKTFARESSDNDAVLLNVLPDAWRNIHVDREEVLQAIADLDDGASQTPSVATMPTRPQQGMVTPQQSPRVCSQTPDKSPGGLSLDGDGSDQHKRAVLLCFNENVRTAEDVFRCHNEFIRDTAHASHLQLTAQEWRHFFGNDAANSPYLWGNVGVPVPYTEFHGSSRMDAPGRMAPEEVCKFRTSWCTKRYEHDHELCGFAHVEVNGGWLRRNPRMNAYKDEMCQAISMAVDQRAKDQCYVIHECPHGNTCQYAHSMEEMMYHPRRYKSKVCTYSGRAGGCPLGEVCSNFHPTETYRFPKKVDGRSARHGKHSHHPPTSSAGGTKAQGVVPAPSPILYCEPAPISSFEDHLGLPGLKNLFRRQCFVVRTHLRKNGACTCCYTHFGNETPVFESVATRPTPPQSLGLPSRRSRP
ncbi:hypothetical protein MPSEU_000995100 [Mayamaea pseudoterrestris]|nr:hypothetical protein MPSEU_000995100 [Mayamaea pseudoterrestris]